MSEKTETPTDLTTACAEAWSAFTQNLKGLRKVKKMSQEKLAAASELSRNYIGLLECGRRTPSLDTCIRISRALGVKLAKLVPGF